MNMTSELKSTTRKWATPCGRFHIEHNDSCHGLPYMLFEWNQNDFTGNPDCRLRGAHSDFAAAYARACELAGVTNPNVALIGTEADPLA